MLINKIIIHDWLDNSYYENLKNEEDLTRWGWEFLRRNPEYQKDYTTFSSLPEESTDGQSKNGKHRGGCARDSQFHIDIFHYTNPPSLKGETFEEYIRRCPSGKIMPYAEYMEEKYHFQPSPIDPLKELNDDIWFFFTDASNDGVFDYDFPPWRIDLSANYECFNSHPNNEMYRQYKDRYFKRVKSYGQQRGVVIFAFDLESGIDKQLKKLKAELIEEAREYKENKKNEENIWGKAELNSNSPKVPSLKVNKFPLYIRILDAMSANAENKAIKEEIYPHEKNNETNNLHNKIKNNTRSAIRWRDKDFWKMGGGNKNTPLKI